MKTHSLRDMLINLFRQSELQDPPLSLIANLQECIEDNGLQDDDHVPAWLVDSIGAVLDGKELPDTLIDSVDGDVANFLSEVSDVLPGCEHSDQGEWIRMTFPALRSQIYISREALDAEHRVCSKYSVKRFDGE
jgi:hypothetical protein